MAISVTTAMSIMGIMTLVMTVIFIVRIVMVVWVILVILCMMSFCFMVVSMVIGMGVVCIMTAMTVRICYHCFGFLNSIRRREKPNSQSQCTHKH